MSSPEILNFSTLEDIEANIELISDKLLKNTVVVVRGARISTEDQTKLVFKLGDTIGTFPNSSSKGHTFYTENHSRLSDAPATKDEILVPWHLEHVEEADPRQIIVGAIWNMYKFDTSPENGNTYFVDTAKLFSNLEPEKQDMLRTTVLKWTLGKEVFFTVPSVGTHWSTGEEVLRIPLNANIPLSTALDLDGNEYGSVESRERLDLLESCAREIVQNVDIRVTHEWQEGDIVFVDLYKNAHAVAGGFAHEDREFTGMWLYSEEDHKGRVD